jgi:hypothetical protein
MKKIYTLALLLISLIAVAGITASCEFDVHEDPDYPLFVTYTISAGEVSFSGPEQLSADIQKWIHDNQVVYDRSVKYSTGEASEFATADAEAAKKFDEFKPKFMAFLEEVKTSLAKGVYGDEFKQVKATFYVFASRAQGNDRDLKYEHIEFVYPN